MDPIVKTLADALAVHCLTEDNDCECGLWERDYDADPREVWQQFCVHQADDALTALGLAGALAT